MGGSECEGHTCSRMALAPRQLLINAKVGWQISTQDAGLLPLWLCGTGLPPFPLPGTLETHAKRDNAPSGQSKDSLVSLIVFHGPQDIPANAELLQGPDTQKARSFLSN